MKLSKFLLTIICISISHLAFAADVSIPQHCSTPSTTAAEKFINACRTYKYLQYSSQKPSRVPSCLPGKVCATDLEPDKNHARLLDLVDQVCKTEVALWTERNTSCAY